MSAWAGVQGGAAQWRQGMNGGMLCLFNALVELFGIFRMPLGYSFIV